MLKLALAVLIGTAIGISTGCHAQVPPTQTAVGLSYTAPTSNPLGPCAAPNPCTYILSRITVTTGTTTCPAANNATPNYTPLNASSPTSALTYTDTSSSALTVCYVAQAEQGGGISVASNTAGPFVVGASPGAPTLGGQVQADMKPPLPEPSPEIHASAPSKSGPAAPVLSAKLTDSKWEGRLIR
jgi:hypothetical protein